MANVQKQFIKFDEAIKLKRLKENATLAEKRERVLRTLSEGIKQQREDGKKIPSYRDFNQGSYEVGVGVKPLDGDYDIDVGIAFDLSRDEHDPVDVKTWVFDAVEDHTSKVEMRGPCVTVFYMSGKEPAYHVDLAVYADEDANKGKLYLARGKPGSQEEFRVWTPSDPEGLTDALNNRHTGDDGKQMRRVIRAMKRWKAVRFATGGHAAPRGIALAVAAFHLFAPATRTVDGKVEYDDLQAIRTLTASMLRRFMTRLEIKCPTDPFDDLCARMTDLQMGDFKTKLEALLDSLRAAAEDPDLHSATKELASQFGSDFPVVSAEAAAKPQSKAIVGSGNSG